MQKIVFILILFVLMDPVFAQQDSATSAIWLPDSAQLAIKPKSKKKVLPPRTFYTTEYSITRNKALLPLDTMMERNELYHSMYFKHGIFQDLGNMGSAGQSLNFSFNRKVDFNLCLNPYESYYIKPEETRYYNNKIPYSDLTYVQGAKELIYLKVRHAQNITPRWSAGVDYFRLSSDGFYPRQKSSLYATQVFTRFQSKSKRYDLLSSFTWNYNLAEESGGFQNDSAFEALSGSNKSGFVNLNFSQTRVKNRTFYLKQYLHFGKKVMSVKESDTTYDFISGGHFSHTLKAEDISYIFESFGDSVSALLPNRFYTASNTTYDSIYHGQLSNRLAYTLYNKNQNNEQRFLEIGGTHKIFEVKQQTLNAVFNNILIDGTLERESYEDNSISFRAYGAYAMLGYNQNDLRLEGDVKLKTTFFNLSGGIFNHLLEPDFTYKYYSSNQFTWVNNLSKINVSNWHANLQTRKFRHNFEFTFNQYLLANWVYFGADAKPTYSKDVILLQTLEAKKTFQLWKFYLENRLIYQKANNDILRLPEFGAVLRYYVQAYLFKKAFKYQLGVDVFYNSSFYGNAYNPATRGFFIQSNKFIGNYPLINPFVTGELRNAIIFAAYEHLNQDWGSNNGFYNTPHHPLPISVFRIGVRWRMYN